jgi:hypothetical protein
VLREFVLFCEQHDDRARLKRALAALREAYPQDVDPERPGGGFLASRWYPAELVHVLVDEVIAGRSEREQDELATRAASVVMGRTLRGVYKFLFSTFASPDLYSRHVQKLWSLHYDNGAVQLENGSAGQLRYAQSRIVRWISHHPFICKLNGAAAVPIYEAMGCRDVTCERNACVSRSGDHCSWRTFWTNDE